MDVIKINNWEKYQHYKKRNPPWIKLHVEILTSRTWIMCDDASRLLAVAIMVLAAKYHNEIPLDPEFIKKVANLKSFNLKPLIDIGFCTVASTLLADASKCLHSVSASASVSDSSEGESREGEWTIYDCMSASVGIGMCKEDVESFWNHYAAVGFIDGAGRKITNLKAALGKWKTSQAERKSGLGSNGRKAATMFELKAKLEEKTQQRAMLGNYAHYSDNPAYPKWKEINEEIKKIKNDISNFGDAQ